MAFPERIRLCCQFISLCSINHQNGRKEAFPEFFGVPPARQSIFLNIGIFLALNLESPKTTGFWQKTS